MNEIVKVRELRKNYGRFPALRGATFSVPRGATVGLLGPNGSGKTTTIKILIGLLRRNGGIVEVFGYDPWQDEIEVKKRVGVLHERPLYPLNARVKEILRYASRLRGYDDREVQRVAGLVGIRDMLDFKVKNLSRGYLQRLGLSLALIGDPELLLLDEPTANLDPYARVEILRLIKTLKEDLGVTVMISSHIIPELKEVCDYAIFIRDGRVADYGPISELALKYGVTATYLVKAERARALARELLSLSYVLGVELRNDVLLVKVKGSLASEFESLVDNVKGDFMVSSFRLVGSELGEIYEKIFTKKS